MIIWLLNFYAIRIYVHLDGANGCWYSCIEWTNLCLQLKYPNSIRDCAFYRYLFFLARMIAASLSTSIESINQSITREQQQSRRRTYISTNCWQRLPSADWWQLTENAQHRVEHAQRQTVISGLCVCQHPIAISIIRNVGMDLLLN